MKFDHKKFFLQLISMASRGGGGWLPLGSLRTKRFKLTMSRAEDRDSLLFELENY